jgi:predicted DNA-binding transcriptional regulator AlpA
MRAATTRDILPASLAPRGLSRVEAARYVGVSPTLFHRMVSEGRMPRPARYGRRLLWDRRQIDRSLDALFNDHQEAAVETAAPEFVL